MATLHKVNLLLCEPERESITKDDDENLSETTKLLDDLEKADIIDVKLLEKCIRTVNSRHVLKYSKNDLLSTRIFNIFHEILMTKPLSFPHKTSMLAHMLKICKKCHNLVLKPINWRALWQEALDIACRSKKDQSVASEAPIVNYMSKLVEFLHGCRSYLITSKSDADLLIAESMEKLRDVRQVFCVDGLLMMLNILPTNYAGYESILPQWISVWCSISNNSQWDMCWLTLLTRARKYTTSYDWKALMPLFSLKARELLGLPTGARDSASNIHDSFCFPQYYAKLKTTQVDPKKVALNKLAKLMYFTTICDPVTSSTVFVRADPLTITTPKLSGVTTADLPNIPGYNCASEVLPIVTDIVLFFQSIRPFIYASNSGGWTQPLAYFITSFVGELGRHVGRSIACGILGPSEEGGSKYVAFERMLHLPTLKFLSGLLTVVSLEGLYSKNMAMSQHFSNNLKNLCSIDPSLGHIVMPFLLGALDPSAVNQTHQAPVSMMAIGVVFKPLLFPSPTILKYLPQVLNLALPGVDTCDAVKTTITLKLFATVLSWVPLKAVYTASDAAADVPQTYLSLSSKLPARSGEEAGIKIEDDQKNAKLHWNAIAACAGDWAVGLLEKIFALLDAHEDPQKGSSSAVDGGIGETLGFLCQAINPSTEPALWALVEDKILDYFKRSTPLNAVKVAGKVVESLVSENPSSLNRILSALLTTDVANGSCSHDKLAFRLRIAGGGVRTSQGLSAENLAILSRYFTTEYTHHSEKSVRKAAVKLVKDSLKGSLSFYPKGVMPYDIRMKTTIGSPNQYEDVQYSWYIPTDQAISTGAKILRTMAIDTMKGIVTLIKDINMSDKSSGDKDTAVPFKKVEESIAFGLKLLQKCLRGAAEVLGDDLSSGALLTLPAVSHRATAMDVDSAEALEDSSHSTLVIHTARDQILSSIHSKEDKQLYASLRYTVLEFLVFCNDSLQALSPAAGAAAGTGSTFSGLFDSYIIQSAWAKTLRVVINARMACLKSADQVRIWYASKKRMSRSVIVKTMLVALYAKENSLTNTMPLSEKGMSSLNYWRGHDMTTNNIAVTGWLQHALRQKQYSSMVNKRSLREADKGPLLLSLMRKLTDLCGHEYSVINLKSLTAFVNIAPRYGKKSLVGVKPLFATLTVPGISYATAAGALSLLAQDVSMTRITQDWESTVAFLRMVLLCPGMIEKVEEQDKRQMLMSKLTNLFVKYVEHWHHFPLTQTPADVQSRSDLFQLLLGSVGFDLKGQVVDSTVSSSEDAPASSRSSSLRHGLFISFALLHFIGHNDIEIPSGVTAWALQTTCTAHGQPTQNVALASLVRIAYILCKQTSPSTLLSLQAPSTSMSLSAIDSVKSIRTALSSPSGWLPFLQGVSQSHPKGQEDGGGSAQWSLGIDHVLRCSEYLENLFPRKMSSCRTESALFSRHFRLCHAGLFLTLTSLLSSGSPSALSADAISPLSVVAAALTAAKSMVSTSEEESRANNSTRAELFAGLLRGFLCQSNDALKNAPSSSIAALEKESFAIEQLLVDFFSEQVEKLSVDYFSDWAEAVFFVTSSGLSKPNGPLCSITLEGFRRVLKVTPQPASSAAASIILSGSESANGSMSVEETDTVKESGEEGFAGQGKALTLTRAALTGEINANALLDASSTSTTSTTQDSNSLGVLIAQILSEQDSDFLSPFRNCRLEIGKIFSLLSENTCTEGLDLSAILLKISIAVNAGVGIPAPDDISMEVANVAIGELPSAGSKAAASVSAAALTASKSAVETACAWAQFMSQTLPSWRSTGCLPQHNGGLGFGGLLSIVLCGSGHADFELAKLAHEVCLRSMQGIKGDMRAGGVRVKGDILSIAVQVIMAHKEHSSFHVRETVMLSGFVLAAKNYYCLSEDELKAIKTLFVDGMHDVKPEVANLAKAGVVSYLALKTPKDLQTLSEAYIKNGDTLASREFKKRKLEKLSSASAALCKPDKMHMTTVLMMSCVIQALPYDLPPFMPALVTSIVRHVTFGPLKETVTKTIQSFKGSHQDRWESDFKAAFTREQLEDLEGAGAAHYFS